MTMGVQKTRKIKLTRKSANLRKKVKPPAPGSEAPKLQDTVVALNTFPEPITPIKVEKIEDIEIETVNESTFGNVTIPVGAIPFTTCTVCKGVMITVEGRVVHLGQPNCIFNASPASESVIDDIAAYNAEEDSSSPASSIETIEEDQLPKESPPTPLSRPRKKRKRPVTSNPSQIDAEPPKRSKLNFDSAAQPEIDDEMIPLIQASYSVKEKKKKPTKKKKLTIHDKKKLIWSCGECRKLFSTQKIYMYHSCGPFVPPNIKY